MTAHDVRPLGMLCVAVLGISLASAAFAGPACDCGDTDGIPDVIDNCTLVSNASQCDTDNDGYGNACDGDFNNDLVIGAVDISSFLAPDFATGTDSGVGTDMNCDGVVGVIDIQEFFAPQFLGAFPGPSGLACAGTIPCP